MGLGDFLKQLNDRFPYCIIKEVYLELFRGKRLAVDVSVYAYRFMAVARKESVKYLDPLRQDPNTNTLRSFWLEKYFSLMVMLIESGITPIAVFDGAHFHLKGDTKEERARKYAERTAKIRLLRDEINAATAQGLPESATKKEMGTLRAELSNHISFSAEDWKALTELFESMGIPVIKLPFEAEAVCARLVRRGYAAGVISTDADCLAHLSGIMIKDVTKNYRMTVPYHKCTCIVLDDVLKALDLNPKEFVEFCMLVGTDYNKRVDGYGFKKCLDLMHKYRSLPDIIAILRPKIEARNAKNAKWNATKPEGKKDRKVVDFEAYRLTKPELVTEIFDYFYKALVGDLERFPVFFYDDTLLECVRDLFEGAKNRERMLKRAEGLLPSLRIFNQRFAALQKFVLVKIEDVNAE